MIYKNPNIFNEAVQLFEEDADEFLESIGVELYDEHISINGMIMEGCIGEDMLAENGIFLYEDGIVLEGEQAEKYLKDKQSRITKERKDEKNMLAKKYGGSNGGGIHYNQGDRSIGTDSDGNAYTSTGYNSGWDRNRSASNNPAYKSAQKMRNYRDKYPDAMPKTKSKNEKELEKAEAKERASVQYGKDIASKHIDPKDNIRFQTAADAARRHYRRTHKNESTILENLKFI